MCLLWVAADSLLTRAGIALFQNRLGWNLAIGAKQESFLTRGAFVVTYHPQSISEQSMILEEGPSIWRLAASTVRQRPVNVNGVGPGVTLTPEAASKARAQLRERR
jgi:hypothetical protein